MNVQGVLVEYEDCETNELFTGSGLLFANKYVIITANVLMPYIQKHLHIGNIFEKYGPGIIRTENLSEFRPKVKIVKNRKTFDQIKNTVINDQDYMSFKNGEVITAVVCNDVLQSTKKYLKDWAIDINENQYQSSKLLSLFFIIEIVQAEEENVGNLQQLKSALLGLSNLAQSSALTVGQEIFIESTPFGNRAFLNSFSQGIISNIIGLNNCLILTDCPSVPGAEGGAIFVKLNGHRTPLGIVLSSLNWWKGEWIGLTLGVNLVSVVSEILQQTSQISPTANSQPNNNFNTKLQNVIEKSLVQVVAGTQWGSGVLIDVQKGIFLTNSHVVENHTMAVLHWHQHQIKAKVIYRTPDADVYDLALLKCDKNQLINLKMDCVKVSTKRVIVGEKVYAVGYPLFSSNLKPRPTLSRGHISQSHASMIKTTCCVHGGASGGAILRPDGDLIGIIVCNTTLEDTGVIYPRMNMAIPIAAVYAVICQYLETKDTTVLNQLHSTDPSTLQRWTFISSKL